MSAERRAEKLFVGASLLANEPRGGVGSRASSLLQVQPRASEGCRSGFIRDPAGKARAFPLKEVRNER
ncbi:hypothetical protein PKB_2380 [Pseudomonas knackmussii B13]|uniref:Uncharacterized protein n=1 Tax=Pseudomonas knackmussii (strain DSM 6978 / CCUG 54928 / LMG 23759 / B13) TaxID=1301098 RepID=A0A024HGU2_PSEKB|nr:hypothetical protein PKB_2380 [Pseudomonas knackmussii B13]